jgi:hypothetical protein
MTFRDDYMVEVEPMVSDGEQLTQALRKFLQAGFHR